MLLETSQLALNTIKLKSRLSLLIREDKGYKVTFVLSFSCRKNCYKNTVCSLACKILPWGV